MSLTISSILFLRVVVVEWGRSCYNPGGRTSNHLLLSVSSSVRPMLKDPIEKKLLCTEIVVSSAVAAAAPSSFVVELI